MSEERCICCGEIIPEGRQVCSLCEEKANMNNSYKTMEERLMDREIDPDEFVDYYNERLNNESKRVMKLDPLYMRKEHI